MTITELVVLLGTEMVAIGLVWVGGAYALKCHVERQNRKRSM